MTLFEGQKKAQYRVDGLYVEEGITRRLQALGLNDGTAIYILERKKNGSMIIKVRGTRLALGKHLTSKIDVTEIGEVKKRDR